MMLVVVSIVSGIKFPKRENHHIIAEARFDNELMSTDPVPHDEAPQIEQEIAWEVSKKMIQHHRLHRTSIKLQLYAVDVQSTAREIIGYIVLDLRAATSAKINKWYTLLHSKYAQNKPQICVGIYIDENDAPDAIEQHPIDRPNVFKNLDLKPVLNEADGLYQIGPDRVCKEDFVFSFTVVSASNLMNLVPSSNEIPQGSSGYYFYFTVLGNEITNEPFFDLIQPNFAPERSSIKLRSSIDALKSFFVKQHADIRLHLCCGDKSLGHCDVPVKSLFDKDLHNLNEAVSVQEQITLRPPRLKQPEQPDSSRDFPPKVEYQLMLRRDIPVTEPQPPQKELQQQPRVVQQESAPPVSAHEHVSQDPSSSISAPFYRNPPQAHHFCCSIELQNIHDLQVDDHLSLYCRYSYPFFGSVAPVITRPPVEIKKFQEVTLPQGYCAFEFAATPEQTHHSFSSQPLLIQVFEAEKDLVVGNCIVPLSAVFSNPKKKYQSTLPVLTGDQKRIADLSILVTLEDYGLIKEQNVHFLNGGRQSPVKDLPVKGVSSDDEYKAALELELWKEATQVEFEEKLKQKEITHMRALADEWRRREREREVLVKKKLSDYAELEVEVRKAANDVEKREKQVAAAEREIARMRQDLQREHSRKMSELRDASARMEADCKQRVESEKARTRQLEEQVAAVKSQSTEWERRWKDTDQALRKQKEVDSHRPEIKLLQELNSCQLEKSELERRLEAANKGKVYYKQQLSKTLQELARAKQREQEFHSSTLQKQQAELEHMRLRYLAAEEQGLMKKDKDMLQKTKEGLESLQSALPNDHIYMNGGVSNDSAQRLVDERDTLLRTGVYSHDDEIIRELERRIQQALAA